MNSRDVNNNPTPQGNRPSREEVVAIYQRAADEDLSHQWIKSQILSLFPTQPDHAPGEGGARSAFGKAQPIDGHFPPMSDLKELLARVEKAEGVDRELDGHIEVAVRWIEAARVGLKPEHRAKWRSNRAGHVSDGFTHYDAGAVTASLDATLALVERVLPGWGFYLRQDKDGCGAALVYPDASRVTPGHETAATPALALLASLLKALIAKENDCG